MKIKILLLNLILLFTLHLQGQTWEWAKQFDNGLGHSEQGKCIGNDNQGNLYVAGTTSYASGSGPYSGAYNHGLLYKFDASGNTLWKIALPYSNGISVTDDEGNTYIAFGSQIGKYNNLGVNVWMKAATIGIKSIYLSPTGAIITAGTRIVNDSSRSFVARYDNNGNFKWEVKISEFGGAYGEKTIFCDINGNTYCTAGYVPNTEFNKMSLLKIDSLGNIATMFNIPSSSSNPLVDSENNIYVVVKGGDVDINGTLYENTLLSFIIKYDQSGNVLWHKPFSGSYPPTLSSVILDKQNNLFITGHYYQSMEVDDIHWADDIEISFVLKMDKNGQIKMSAKSSCSGPGLSDGGSPCSSGSSGSSGNAILVTPDNSIYIVGFVYYSQNFGATTLSVGTMYTDMLLAKITDESIISVNEISNNISNLIVSPNPSSSVFNVYYENKEDTGSLYLDIKNILGKIVYKEAINDFNGSLNRVINLTQFAKGVYFIELRTEKAKEVKKIIVE